MCGGMFLRGLQRPRTPGSVFQLIYAQGMFLFRRLTRHFENCFNSYMCGECFAVGKRGDRYARVSTHICAGNVSERLPGMLIGGDVSTHICAGNVFVLSINASLLLRGFNSYMRGECFTSPTLQGGEMMSCFNSYMRGECFLPHQV